MKTMSPKRVVWPLALVSAAFMFGCQEQTSSPVEPEGLGPQFSAKKCEAPGGGALPGCGSGGGGSGESATVVLSGGYSTPGPQDIKFGENGRRVIVRTEDGAQINYSVNIPDITLPFAAESCVWSGLAGAAAAVGFWNTFPFADDLLKNLLFRVNKKAEGKPDGEHRTEARWWVEDPKIDPEADDARVMYLVKVGVPGKVLADQLSELPDPEFDFEPATGTINGTVVEITGGAVRLSRHFCGAATEGTAGCGPQAPTLEVACINPPRDQVFTATVTP